MHEITTDENGNSHGTDGQFTVSLLRDPMADEARMFKRRAIKQAGSADAVEVNWLVAELNGVRVYQNGAAVIVTTQDLYP